MIYSQSSQRSISEKSISPNDLSREVLNIAEDLKIKKYIQLFQSKHQGFADAQSIISRCWDLDRIHKKYASFIAKYRPKLENENEMTYILSNDFT